MPADKPLAVEHAEPAEPAEFDGEGGRDQRVGGMGDDGDVEPVGIQLPTGRHVLGRAGPPGRHDVDPSSS